MAMLRIMSLHVARDTLFSVSRTRL